MDNPFVEIVRQAVRNKWCTTPFCTTCGSMEYRHALRKLSGPLGGPLSDALSEINIKEFTTLPNWQGALVIAIIEIPISLQLEGILNSWMEKADDKDIDFIDLVLFRIIKMLSDNNPMKTQWIDYCTDIAKKTMNPSLIESLILVMKRKSINYPELITMATQIANDSKQMQRVLLNACGIKVTESK